MAKGRYSSKNLLDALATKNPNLAANILTHQSTLFMTWALFINSTPSESAISESHLLFYHVTKKMAAAGNADAVSCLVQLNPTKKEAMDVKLRELGNKLFVVVPPPPAPVTPVPAAAIIASSKLQVAKKRSEAELPTSHQKRLRESKPPASSPFEHLIAAAETAYTELHPTSGISIPTASKALLNSKRKIIPPTPTRDSAKHLYKVSDDFYKDALFTTALETPQGSPPSIPGQRRGK